MDYMAKCRELIKLSKAQSADDFESLNVPLILSLPTSDTCLYVTTLAVFHAYFSQVLPGIERRKLYDLYYFIYEKKRVDMMEPFFDHLTLEELKNADGGRYHRHVWVAIYHGCVDVMTFLLDKGLDVNFRNAGEETFLSAACLWGNVDIVDLLLQKGADVSPASSYGTAVFYAVKQRDITILDRLIMAGADLHVVNDGGCNLWSILVRTQDVADKEAFFQRLADMRVQASKKDVEYFRAARFSGDAEVKERMLKLILSAQEE